MKKRAAPVLAACLLLVGCEGITEPRYPPTNEDNPDQPGDEKDDDAAQLVAVTLAEGPYRV